jgi:hemolysin activation/secretion protein
VGTLQAYSRIAGNSVFRTGDQLAVEAFGTPDKLKELKYGGISYTTPVNDIGTTLTSDGAVTTIRADDLVRTETHNARVGLRVSHAFLRMRHDSLTGTLGVNIQNINSRLLDVLAYEDRVRTIFAATDYASQHWNGLTTLGMRTTVGFDMPGETEKPVLHSRPDAGGRFFKFNLDVSRYQPIGNLVGLYVAGRTQLSANPLLVSEEMSLGGAQFGRAYDYGEISGEDGVAGLIEGRVGRDPKIPGIEFVQLYSYYDAGSVWNRNAAFGAGQATLSSAGTGIRLNLPKSVLISSEVALPLTRTPVSQGDKGLRVFFSTSINY